MLGPVQNQFAFGPKTENAGTVIVQLIPPRVTSANGAPLLYKRKDGTGAPYTSLSGLPNWTGPGAKVTRIGTLIYTTQGTAHLVGVMRPLNFCYLTAAAAAAQKVINVDVNPGNYSTKYRYPTPNGASPRTANNLLAANDYCAYQVADGTWFLDTVASVSSLAITMTTNIPTGGIAKGAPLFFFGVITDTDPATATTQPQITIPASQTLYTIQDFFAGAGLYANIHPGDPVMFYSPNNAAAGTLDLISGYYAGISG